MKKLTRCPICGSKGEDAVFAFYCTNKECQNFRKDINPIISDKEEEKPVCHWPSYDDD